MIFNIVLSFCSISTHPHPLKWQTFISCRFNKEKVHTHTHTHTCVMSWSVFWGYKDINSQSFSFIFPSFKLPFPMFYLPTHLPPTTHSQHWTVVSSICCQTKANFLLSFCLLAMPNSMLFMLFFFLCFMLFFFLFSAEIWLLTFVTGKLDVNVWTVVENSEKVFPTQ